MLKGRFKQLQEKLLSECKKFYGEKLVSLVIFGSVARETYNFNSDVDILIIAEELPKGRMRRVAEFSVIEENLKPFLKLLQKEGINTYLSSIFKTPEEAKIGSPLFLDMVEDARILFDRDGFFSSILEKLRKKLKELGSIRVWKGDKWYWILKPDYKPGDVIEL